MNEKELYRQKKQAQLDEWKAEVDKLKAKAAKAGADAKLQLNKQIEALEDRLEQGKTRLAELADTSGEAWEAARDDVESAWKSMKAAFSEAAARFKA